MGAASHLAISFLLFVVATAHFILEYPPSLGFDDDIEANGPCGGFDVVFNSSDASVPIGGFPVSMLSTHPEAEWIFRATLDQQAPFNWTDLTPVLQETGLGQFCIPNVQAPTEFAGKPALVQVIQHGADGVLYQCAAVNFVNGVNTTVSSSCQNATGLTVTESNATDIISSSPSSSSSSPSASSSMTTTTASSTASPSASATGTSTSSALALRVAESSWISLAFPLAGLALAFLF